jgi:hypothetical protein
MSILCILRAMPAEVPDLIQRVFTRKQRRKLSRWLCGACEQQLHREGCGAIDWFDDLSHPCSAKTRYYRALKAVRCDGRRGKQRKPDA